MKEIRIDDEVRNYNQNRFDVIENNELVKEFYKILIDNDIVELDQRSGKMKKLNKNKVVVGKLLVKSMFGFVLSDEDLYIHNPSNYFDGDIVVAIESDQKLNKKKEGTILGCLKRSPNTLLVEVKKEKNLIPIKENYLSYQVSLQDKLEFDYFNERQIIELEIIDIKARKLITKFKRVISDANDPDLDMKIVLASHSIEVDFSEETLEQVKLIKEVAEEDLIGRVDLRNETIMTIDGADSKDLDDAISLIKEKNGWRLTVSIADVSHYVVEDTPLDNDAYSRSTSVYFIDRVVPMIPKTLSNGICSLHPNVDRLTISCEMLINENGHVVEHKIFPSVINSKYRLTYDEVNDVLEGKTVEHLAPINGILHEMNKLRRVLNKKRLNRGSFNLEDKDAKFTINDEGKITDIKPFLRKDAEKLIEEFMIIANECVAEHVYWMELPFLYRIHDQPNPKKLRDVLSLFSLFGIQIKGDVEEFKPQMFKQALDQLDDEISKRIVSDLIVRSLSKAKYQRENIGHFGLASKFYTHFTSPIRRYPDLIVHRKLRQYLFENKIDFTEQDENLMDEIGNHTSEKEVSAIKAEQQIEDMKKAEYMGQFIGEKFDGIVASIVEYGFYVELDNTVRGLIKFSRIKEYTKTLNHKIYFNSKENPTLTIGSKVVVTLTSINYKRGIVEFDLDGFTMIAEVKRTPTRKKKFKKEERTVGTKRTRRRYETSDRKSSSDKNSSNKNKKRRH